VLFLIGLLGGQANVAVSFFARHLTPEPRWRLEFSARCAVGKFHFRYHQPAEFASVNVNLDEQILPRNFVTQLAQASPRCGWPECGELFCAELDFALFSRAAAAYFEGQRGTFTLSAQPNMSPSKGLDCQIALCNWIMPPTTELFRQPSNQKFSFDFPIGWRSTIPLHKIKMLNTMSVVVEIFGVTLCNIDVLPGENLAPRYRKTAARRNKIRMYYRGGPKVRNCGRNCRDCFSGRLYFAKSETVPSVLLDT
jgi:hypothetical protein